MNQLQGILMSEKVTNNKMYENAASCSNKDHEEVQ